MTSVDTSVPDVPRRERARLSFASDEVPEPAEPQPAFAYWCGRFTSLSDKMRNEDMERREVSLPDRYFSDDDEWTRRVFEHLETEIREARVRVHGLTVSLHCVATVWPSEGVWMRDKSETDGW